MSVQSEFPAGSLGHSLTYSQKVLNFGTSGRRGEVLDLSSLEIYLNVRAELDYLMTLPADSGGISRGQYFYLAHDLRPSSTKFVATQGGRGELLQAAARAVRDAGLLPVNLGAIPTPALAAYALTRRCGSIMVTGSHIPFARNGYKTNSAVGELLKQDETPITERALKWREKLYRESLSDSLFDRNGHFKTHEAALSGADPAGAQAYLARYFDFFGAKALRGLRILVYQHSAVGRDLVVEVLTALGAEVHAVGRSETFVPIDTEAIDQATLDNICQLVPPSTTVGCFDAVVSTDGDSDRPLLIGLRYTAEGTASAQFFGGDLVGMIVAETLDADAVVVPISCNDGVDRGALASRVQPKTRIGSPYVIAGMQTAIAAGYQRVCGWEANGGFLTATDIIRAGRVLSALPTRDAMLPIIGVLAQAATGRALHELFGALPARFSRAGLLRDFARAASLKIITALSPPVEHAELTKFFSSADGFGVVRSIDYTDGVRISFSNGDIAHIRPSGNADELRLYAVADTQARADKIVELGIREPAGILRRLAAEYA